MLLILSHGSNVITIESWNLIDFICVAICQIIIIIIIIIIINRYLSTQINVHHKCACGEQSWENITESWKETL